MLCTGTSFTARATTVDLPSQLRLASVACLSSSSPALIATMLSLLNVTQHRTVLMAACRSVPAPMRWFADSAEQDPLADWRVAARQQAREAQLRREDERGALALRDSCMAPCSTLLVASTACCAPPGLAR